MKRWNLTNDSVEDDLSATPALARLGDVLAKCPGGDNNGFDHNFALANTEGKLNFFCRVSNGSDWRPWSYCREQR